MANPHAPTDGSRITAVLLVAVLHGLLLAGLVAGLAPGRLPVAHPSAMLAITAPPPLPPPPPPPPKPHQQPPQSPPKPPAGAAATPNPIPAPAPQITASRIALSPSPAGRSAQGNGTGTAAGADTGAGTGEGATTRPEKLAGDIRVSDYPAASRAQRIGHAVLITFTVGTDGRVHDCQIREPSPDPEADVITCRLAEQRFRFRPAMDATGNPVTSIYGWRQKWFN